MATTGAPEGQIRLSIEVPRGGLRRDAIGAARRPEEALVEDRQGPHLHWANAARRAHLPKQNGHIGRGEEEVGEECDRSKRMPRSPGHLTSRVANRDARRAVLFAPSRRHPGDGQLSSPGRDAQSATIYAPKRMGRGNLGPRIRREMARWRKG